MTELTKIEFHGSTLLAMAGDSASTTLIAMKPLFEGAGVPWEAQRKRLSRHPVLSASTSIMEVETEAGPRETVFLPLDRVDFALATLHPDRVKDAEARAKLILYQTEAAAVLYAHFQPRREGKPRVTLREVGGVVKGITTKAMLELAEKVAEMTAASERRVAEAIAAAEKRASEAAAASEARMEAIAHGHDPSVGKRMRQKTMLEIVQENGVQDKKGRAKLTRALSAGMVPWCRANGVLTGQTSERKTILYPVECIPRWLDEVGRAKIRAHIAEVTGQETFDFAAEKKKRGK